MLRAKHDTQCVQNFKVLTMFFRLLAIRLFLLALLWSCAYSQSILLTEVMANPHSLSDSDGEYIEVVLRDSSLQFPSPLIIHKEDSAPLSSSYSRSDGRG